MCNFILPLPYTNTRATLKIEKMEKLESTVKNIELSFEERMSAVLTIHMMNNREDAHSKVLWDISFHEGGSIEVDLWDNKCSLSGDEGRVVISLTRLMEFTEKTRTEIASK